MAGEGVSNKGRAAVVVKVTEEYRVYLHDVNVFDEDGVAAKAVEAVKTGAIRRIGTKTTTSIEHLQCDGYVLSVSSHSRSGNSVWLTRPGVNSECPESLLGELVALLVQQGNSIANANTSTSRRSVHVELAGPIKHGTQAAIRAKFHVLDEIA